MKIKKSELTKIIANAFKKYFKDIDKRIFSSTKEIKLIKNLKSIDKRFNSILNKAKQISNDYLKDIDYHNYELDIMDIKCLDILDEDYSSPVYDDLRTDISSLNTYFNFDFGIISKYPDRDMLLLINVETLLNDIMNTMYSKVKEVLYDRYDNIIYITDKYFDNEYITFEIEISHNTIIIDDTLYIIEDIEDFDYIFNIINKYKNNQIK